MNISKHIRLIAKKHFSILTFTAIAASSPFVFAGNKTQGFKPDANAQIPAAFNQSYVGFGVGYTDIPFNNSHLNNAFRAQSFTNPTVGLNVYIGHFFNRYLAGQISLMRPIKWAYANNINGNASKNSIWISLFGLTLRPTLPLSNRSSLYAQAGLGIISRHGFRFNNQEAIPSSDIFTFLTGGGYTYAITPHWHLNLGVEYALARKNHHQPHMLYTYASFYYLIKKLHLPATYPDHFIFHKNLIQAGGFSTSVFDPEVNKYFTVGYLPIFWTGDVKTKSGGWFIYERNIFHSHKYFSFDLGASFAFYHSALSNQSFQTFSIFPSIKLYIYRSPLADFYFTYAVAGPTYITDKTIDGINTGGHFTFQDLLGFGLFLGKQKNVNINFKIGHYSNGNLWPNNPGIQVPLVFSIGYAFN